MQFHAAIQGDLAVLREFNELLSAFGAPPIENGSASIRWSGSGTKSLLDITGSGEITVTDVKSASVPDPVSITLRTKHEGGHAEISSLSVATGKWRADAAASLTADEVRLSKLTISNDGAKLIDGEARVPLALSQEPRPSPPIDPQHDLMLRLQTQPLELSRIFAIIGKQAPVNGVLRGDVDLHGTLHAPQGKISFSLADARADAA